MDLNAESGRKVLSEFDFVISPGRSDANPTVLLEAMSLGLIPICTPESGYDDPEYFISLTYGKIPDGCSLLESLQNMSAEELVERQRRNFSFVENYSWDRFTKIVIDRILKDHNSESVTEVTPMQIKSKALEIVRSANSPFRKWRVMGVTKIVENRWYFWHAKVRTLFSK